MEILKKNILKTLLYYDIFSHPLNDEEIFTFLPKNSIPKEKIKALLKEFSVEDSSRFAEKEGYYYIKPFEENISKRIFRENYSRKVWKAAFLVTHIIKRFPFVRSVMVTGTLSKNSSDETSDLDFMVITAEGRLWIARTLLMLFKKAFLLNSKKYFCINYFITEDSLEITERNIYTATEITTIKPTFNTQLAEKFLQKNGWVTQFFPNYIPNNSNLHKAGCRINNRKSVIQKALEILFPARLGEGLDEFLRLKTIEHWKKKYPHLTESERDFRLRSTKTESKAHPYSVQKQILSLYEEKLKTCNL
jgi:hypothetical protein